MATFNALRDQVEETMWSDLLRAYSLDVAA